MARYADTDHKRYARLTDTAICIGVVAIALHLIFGTPVRVLTIDLVFIVAFAAAGLYFKLRVKDEPLSPATN